MLSQLLLQERPSSVSAGPSHLLDRGSSLLFSVTGHGTFADGPVASTWLFTMQGDTLANAGVLAHDDQVDPFVLVDGRGTPFSVHGAIPRGCTTSGLRDLRAAGVSDRPVYYASDGGVLLALRYRTVPARACKGVLVHRQRTVTSMLLDELDPERGTWSTRTTASRSRAASSRCTRGKAACGPPRPRRASWIRCRST